MRTFYLAVCNVIIFNVVFQRRGAIASRVATLSWFSPGHRPLVESPGKSAILPGMLRVSRGLSCELSSNKPTPVD